MALETDALCGAGHREHTGERIYYRNGFRDRNWETRTGTVDVRTDWPYRWLDATYYPESLDRETWFEPLLVDDTFCPTEGLGVCVMACDEALDVIDELRDAGERASFQRFGRQGREPDLDLIQP